MSLTSGLKSITGSAGCSAARRVPLGASLEPEEEESEVGSSAEDEGISDGSQDGDGSYYGYGLASLSSRAGQAARRALVGGSDVKEEENDAVSDGSKDSPEDSPAEEIFGGRDGNLAWCC